MRAKYLLLIAAFFGGVLSTPAQAVPSEVKSVDAPWVYFYADHTKSAAIEKSPAPREFSVDKALAKSTFSIDFTNTPEIYRPAITAAADVWSLNFTSKVPVKMQVLWERQASKDTLAAASPGKFHNNFANIPDPDLWYASALADAIAGEDIEPTFAEITIRINSTNSAMLYLGTDGNCPSTKYDLESMMLHEMAHGLGFLSNADYDNLYGYGSIQQPTPFDAYAQLPDGRRLMDLDSPSQELGKALIEPLVWAGANGIRANNGIKPALYTPSTYQRGSSVSHLDEATFSASQRDVVMTPNLKMGEVFHEPGPLLIAIFDDLSAKPPVGIPYGLPGVPRNVKALVGNRSALISFDPPVNQRTAQVTSYIIKVNQSEDEQIVLESPALISGLSNGIVYSFTITAKNEIGLSQGATTNAVIPQASWKKTVIDSKADGKYLATGKFAGRNVVAYSDTNLGTLKLATRVGRKWTIQTVDGYSTKGGRTKNNVAGAVSLCTVKSGKTEYLNIYYGDLTDKDLRRASFNGKKWSYEVIDGDGPIIQDYKESARVRTASDVSVSNACAITGAGEQVFYRDESQGILLGAVRDGKKWRYEILDGDSLIAGRTMGDVRFRLKATTTGAQVNVMYDSVLSVSNSDKSVLRGDVRIARRITAFPEDWVYQALQVSDENTIVAGYDVALDLNSKISNTSRTLNVGWLGASAISLPIPDQLQWSQVGADLTPFVSKPDYFGVPSSPLSVDSTAIIFGCQDRLCSLNKTDQTISLITDSSMVGSKSSEWVTLGKVKYALVSSGGKLSLFKKR